MGFVEPVAITSLPEARVRAMPIFGVMTDRLMRTGVTSFHPIFPAVMTLLSGASIALKWSESVNWFVLIFASATLLCYLSVGIVAYRREPVLTK